ncbi:MAG: 2-C-methyl-D-erythritol 2,4-cyclodiphosphate synthase [Kiritimatiellae bacterium]|nr:2-C-methyl-D-erythritol 2,4-cyclodiphosphate synthase [Kiritimatiellia bacterium]
MVPSGCASTISTGFRVGFGYDSHRFEAGRRLVLCGTEIEGETGLKGHSDADVVLHAVIDALLGAAALGDIGSHFPDTDEKWRGADSAKLLSSVVDEVSAAGWRVGNVDVTVICERPKLRPHVEAMRLRLAGLLRCPVGGVSLKGKTNEKMDDVGAGVGIEVHAACLLEGIK